MLIDTNNMTPEQVNVLVNQLLGPIVAALRGSSKVQLTKGAIVQNADICILDRGMIGQPTRQEIKDGWDEFDKASNADEKIAALADVTRGHGAVILGRNEDAK